MNRLGAWAQLLRLPNLFTAIADPAAGFFLVGLGFERWTDLAVVATASACLYAGGAVLNDAFDVRRDAAERPGRPIPAGMVSLTQAVAAGSVLLVMGVGVCFTVGGDTRWIAAALACGVIAYDGMLKKTFLAPAVMGACRGLNLLLGASIAADWSGPATGVAAGLLWLYVASVTFFARREAAVSSRRRLGLGALGIVAAVMGLVTMQMALPGADTWYLLLVGVLLGQVAVPAWRAVQSRSPGDVQRAVKTFVVSIIVFDACVVMAARGPLPAALILLLLVPTAWLAARIRVT